MELFVLFKLSFLAATIAPFGCEPYFIYLLKKNEINYSLVIFVATLGNTLGSITTYILARYFPSQKFVKLLSIDSNKLEKVKKIGLNKELYLAFFCWVPVFGDIFAFYLGLISFNVKKFFIVMSLGKLFRFIMVWLFLDSLIF